ncbi:MAG: DUF4275 family protein [Oscillospiraceae bacterium]|nr:DUF4275 family protein [Oscillospiraceae bacterium]
MTGNEFYCTWLDHFAKGISKENIEKYVVSTGNYIWHVFSWELLDKSRYLTGDEAKSAYDEIDKSGAVCIRWWFDEGETEPLGEKLKTAAALDKFDEIYVAAGDFSWTYIKTHEDTCGPYFMKL